MALLKPIITSAQDMPGTPLTIHPAMAKLAITTSEGIRLVRWQEILRCHADSNYTRIMLKDKTELLICKTLMKVENALPGEYFIRVHKSHLLRLDQIRMIRPHDLLLETGETIPVSKAGRKMLMHCMHTFSRQIP